MSAVLVPRAAAFLTDLVVRKLTGWDGPDGRGTWRLFAPLLYYSAILGREVEVPEGFKTDFASVPRLPVVFLFMGNAVHEAAVVHDFLYSVHYDDCPRQIADKVFREACIACGSYAWKAELFYAGVRLGGEGPWEAAGQVQEPHVAAVIDAG